MGIYEVQKKVQTLPKNEVAMKNQILEYLKENKHRYVKSGELQGLFNLSDVQVRGYIRELRLQEEDEQPIISDVNGFRYTENVKELLSCYLSLRKRGVRVLQTAKGLHNYIKRTTSHQLEFDYGYDRAKK